ncbi:MAG: CopG family ribbon-helix-helix protein [Pseudorhodoplanes sp.]
MYYDVEVAVSTTLYYTVGMKKLPPSSIRYDPDVKEFLDALAEEQDRGVGWIVNDALRKHFNIPKAAKPAAKKKR